MFALPDSVVNQYDAVLKSLMIPVSQFADFKKWLRYFLDFCAKYPAELNNTSEQVLLFLDKLREKKQSEELRKQAEYAIKLYVGMQERGENECAPENHVSDGGEAVMQCLLPVASSVQKLQDAVVHGGSSHYCEAGYQEKSDSPEWDAVLSIMA